MRRKETKIARRKERPNPHKGKEARRRADGERLGSV